MKKAINSILILLIIVVYTFVFAMKPLGASVLAGGGSEAGCVDETEEETQIEESESESETEQTYTDDDFYELSHVIQAEAGYTYWDMMIGVGSVVLNRKESDVFPNTVYEVIHQPGQYSTVSYLASQVPTAEVEEVTDYLLRNGSQYPADVLYQANFPQGSGTYLTLSTSYSTMYFCYG